MRNGTFVGPEGERGKDDIGREYYLGTRWLNPRPFLNAFCAVTKGWNFKYKSELDALFVLSGRMLERARGDALRSSQESGR